MGADRASVKIYTLGRFDLLAGGASPAASRKTPHKPLTMLKALVALGGKDVSKTALVDILWPDAEGDAAHQSFTTTLHRLRKLLGDRKALRLKSGLVSLDPEICWVDAWAFESMLDGAGENPGESTARLEEAVALYRGAFLPADEAQPWTASARERLRAKYRRAVERLCEHWEREGRLDKAVDCYHNALAVEDTSEDLYRNLMRCYKKLGRKSDAASVYNRCCKVLRANLGVGPSPETEEIYRSCLKE